MRQVAVLVVLISLLGSNIIAQDHLTERFVKPMKLKPSVSGSFGELRSNHFHSGIDLTTNRKTGYRIYASDKGHVSRIKVSPFGYGKAIYIDHKGGYTTVYAHLERYSSRIDSLVQARQYESKSFAIELFFKPGELDIERGEVIGYSGNSGGSGGPHLHYEIRDQASQKPMDPMAFRSDVVDNVRPQIQGLKLYVLSESASISGKRADRYTPAVYYDRAFHPKGATTYTAYGKIGVGVQVLDYLSDSWRKCGVSRINLYSNDTLVYDFHIDTFSFAETRYINSHIDYAEKKRSGKVIQKSFVEPNNRLSLYGTGKEFTIDIKEGDTKVLKYVIKDYSGNTSVLTFTLKGEKPLPPLAPSPANTIKVKYNQAVELDTLGMRLNIPSNTFYTDIDLFLHKKQQDGLVAPLYVIGDKHIPLHRAMTISLPVPNKLFASKNKIVVAGVTSSGKLYAMGGVYKSGFLTVSTRNFGRFTLAIDSIPPVVKLKNAPANRNYAARQAIDIIISDDLSGIAKYNCFINDKWALFEYDAKRKLLIGQFKSIPFLKKGKHKLRVEVLDKRGNKTVKHYNFSR